MTVPTTNIVITTLPTPLWKRVVGWVAFWGSLVTAIGWSRIWFGGAFILEAIAAVFALAGLAHFFQRKSGAHVNMTRDEMKSWVVQGMPANVQAWRKAVDL